MEIIDDLRNELDQPRQPAPRGLPTPSIESENRLLAAARRINSLPDWKRLSIVAAMVYENARLTEEVNQLRDILDFELLPVYDPLTGIKNGSIRP